MSKATTYTIDVKFTPNPDFLKSWFQAVDNKYGEVLGEVKVPEPDVHALKKGAFGLVIDGPWRGYKVKVVGFRGQVLPRTTQYVYEVKSWNINDIPNFNAVELAIPIEDLVPYTQANLLIYGS